MLADKLRGAAAAALPIEYIGGYAEGFAGTLANKTISLTALTGGLASAPAAGDFVVIYFGTGSQADRNLVVAGYTEVTELYSNNTQDTNLVVAYKFMSATPDTTLTLTGGTISSSDAGAVAIQVWRNVDAITPFDVASQTATGTAPYVDPPAITPITDGAIIVAGGSVGVDKGPDIVTNSELTGFIAAQGDAQYDTTVGLGYLEWTSGPFDPAAFGFTGATNSGQTWAAVTLALRPA